MTARDYFQLIQQAINATLIVIVSDVSYHEIDTTECYIRGVVSIVGGLQFHLAEYAVTTPIVKRIKYRYHLQKPDETLLVRWDNVPHHPQVSTFPHHRHEANGAVHESVDMDIPQAMKAIIPFALAESGGARD